LAQGFDEFPESPPPGLVTVPASDGISVDAYAMSGFRLSGARAIRIDMLERLSDMLRDKDSRGGFEADEHMLSITGLSLEQFSDLIQGLGFAAEKGERPKVKAAPEGEAAAEAPAEAAEPAEPEMDVFYTFTWAGNKGGNKGAGKPKPERRGPAKKKKRPQQQGAKSYSAKPEKKDKIDPDNPFAAALMGLKDNG